MISRRIFLRFVSQLVGTTAVLLASCQRKNNPIPQRRRVKLGPLSNFLTPTKVLFLERIQVNRDRNGLSAMSLTCTHQSCMVHSPLKEPSASESSASFICPCHGSEFNQDGKVLRGPASVDLPWLALEVDENKQLWAIFGSTVSSHWRLPIEELA